jgi:predicted outer membrane repeat protein
LRLEDADANIVNSTLDANVAAGVPDGAGGAISGDRPAIILRNATLTRNVAGGTGGAIHTTALSSVVQSNSSLLAGNLAGGSPNNCAHPMTNSTRNIEDADTCGLPPADNLLNTDPLLGPLAANGGPTMTRALLPGSPALDFGQGCPAVDQRNVARPQGPACDSGAFELVVNASPNPNPTVGPGPGPVGGGPVADVIAPLVSGFATDNARFRRGNPPALRAAASAPAPRGTHFRFTLSEPAAVTITFQRREAGRRVAARCVKPTRRNRSRPRCTRLVSRGVLTANGNQGANAVTFSGRNLPFGRYHATIVATDAAGNRSIARLLNFTLVRR